MQLNEFVVLLHDALQAAGVKVVPPCRVEAGRPVAFSAGVRQLTIESLCRASLKKLASEICALGPRVRFYELVLPWGVEASKFEHNGVMVRSLKEYLPKTDRTVDRVDVLVCNAA